MGYYKVITTKQRLCKYFLLERVFDRKRAWIKARWVKPSGTEEDGTVMYVPKNNTKAIRMDNADWVFPTKTNEVT